MSDGSHTRVISGSEVVTLATEGQRLAAALEFSPKGTLVQLESDVAAQRDPAQQCAKRAVHSGLSYSDLGEVSQLSVGPPPQPRAGHARCDSASRPPILATPSGSLAAARPDFMQMSAF